MPLFSLCENSRTLNIQSATLTDMCSSPVKVLLEELKFLRWDLELHLLEPMWEVKPQQCQEQPPRTKSQRGNHNYWKKTPPKRNRQTKRKNRVASQVGRQEDTENLSCANVVTDDSYQNQAMKSEPMSQSLDASFPSASYVDMQDEVIYDSTTYASSHSSPKPFDPIDEAYEFLQGSPMKPEEVMCLMDRNLADALYRDLFGDAESYDDSTACPGLEFPQPTDSGHLISKWETNEELKLEPMSEPPEPLDTLNDFCDWINTLEFGLTEDDYCEIIDISEFPLLI